MASVVVREPRLAWDYARSAWQSRLVGPLTQSRRPGAVAVFHVGRCGSTVLTDLLAQHRDIHSDGETYVRVIEAARAAGTLEDLGEGDPVGYVARRLKRSGRHWFLYDLKFDHVIRLGASIEAYLAGIEAIGVSHWVGWIQVVSATSWLNRSAGVSQSSVFRGLVFSR